MDEIRWQLADLNARIANLERILAEEEFPDEITQPGIPSKKSRENKYKMDEAIMNMKISVKQLDHAYRKKF